MRHLRPPEPEPAGPGRESVWTYPRPPAIEQTGRLLRVVFEGRTVAETRRGLRILERSHPPTYYFPPDDVAQNCLRPTTEASLCEWKGGARYFDVVGPTRIAQAAAWTYPNPVPAFRRLKNHIAFYAGRVDSCWVDDMEVRPQEGDFYGGWITADLAGPFKGPPGTDLW